MAGPFVVAPFEPFEVVPFAVALFVADLFEPFVVVWLLPCVSFLVDLGLHFSTDSHFVAEEILVCL